MNPLKTASLVMAVLLMIFIGGSALISKDFYIQRSVFVAASDTVAFNYASNYKLFNKWNPWYESSPLAKYDVSGSPGASGHTFSWKGTALGQGKFEYLTHEPYKAIYQKITLENPVKGSFIDNMYFYKTYKGTIVTWTFSGQNKSILDKWKSLFYDDMIGEDYQKGLDKFKDELEDQELSHTPSDDDDLNKL